MFRFLFSFILLFGLTGCTTTREYNSLKFLPRSHELAKYDSISGIHSSVFTEFFTPKAQEALRGIPVVDGLMFQPFVIGVNFWSRLGGVLLFNGFSSKVIISKEYMYYSSGPRTILHEYLHHLDFMDREGRGEWIDHREFALAFHRMLQDPKWRNVALAKRESANSWITNIFGIGELSELIAYVGALVATDDTPDYMRQVFKRIFKQKIISPSS